MNISVIEQGNEGEGQEYSFSDADFAMISELANRRYGLFLQESKKALVYSRLARRLRLLGLQSFKEYCCLLEKPEGDDEHSHLLSALTTNVTHFFREKHHFELLKSKVLPSLAEKAKKGDGVRLWSSACSSGQEAYCIASTVLEVFPHAADYDLKVLATDIDPAILQKAKTGQYPNDQRNAIPPEHAGRMIQHGSDDTSHFLMADKVRNLISFGQLNLIEAWPMRRQFDVIFCRNAAIYFDKETQARLWARFADALSPEGYLMIGHSERLSGDAVHSFKSVGVTAYQKVGSTSG